MSVVSRPAHELGFDPEALRRKYLEERDKRLRENGDRQYVEIAGQYEHYRDDPYVDPGFTRDPIAADVDVLVVGGGFSGLMMAARLRDAGIDDLHIVEKGGDFGGTWYWNRYPGAACDIESYIYMPLLEEVGYVPKEKYASAPEILEYSRMLARRFDLYRNALFQTEVTEMRWDEARGRWIVTTDRGDELRPRFLCIGSGLLNRPKLPGIPGVETFKGHSFHTSRWDYDYTGGDSSGNLSRLKDKRVGIIGTGATAVQAVPHLGAAAKALYVFQRTPSSVDIRNNRPTDQDWAQGLEPGWQRRRMDNFDIIVSGGIVEEDLVDDYWTKMFAEMMEASRNGRTSDVPVSELLQIVDYRKQERVRARIDATVRDPQTADALKPWYNTFCKRPTFHDEYLETFNRPNVFLVDTQGKGVERITENAVVVDGRAYEIDCLIYATGFETNNDWTHRAGFELYGRGGLTLTEKWREGFSSLHGLYVADFPNCFIVGGPQTGASANYPSGLDSQARHVVHIIRQCLERQVKTIAVKPEAEARWQDLYHSKSRSRDKFLAECTPGYYNNEGKVTGSTFFSGYGGGPFEYLQILQAWREAGLEDDMELIPQ